MNCEAKILDTKCRCEPCDIDLSALFPGAEIFYEDPAFEGTRCKWHWIVKFEKAQTMTVAPSGATADGARWLWVDRIPGLPRSIEFKQEASEQGQHGYTIQVPVSAARYLDMKYKARRA